MAIGDNSILKRLETFALDNELNPFNSSKTSIKGSSKNIFLTRDSKLIYNRTLANISKNFVFSETSNFFGVFDFPDNSDEIILRQNFFKSLKGVGKNNFLNDLKIPKPFWKPKYGIVVVTENEKTLMKLKEIGAPVRFLITESDVRELEEMDIVQVVDCDSFSMALERLPQSIFLNSWDEAYLERYVEKLSGWKYNLDVLRNNLSSGRILEIVNELSKLTELYEESSSKKFSKSEVEDGLEKINEKISFRMNDLTLSGSSLMEVLRKGTLTDDLKKIVGECISESGLPTDLFYHEIPVKIDENTLLKKLREQDLNEYTNIAEQITNFSDELRKIPEILSELLREILIFDFVSGIANWMSDKENYPLIGERLFIENAGNLFLDNPQRINFLLDSTSTCSILTGANSGGKTTLLENLIQYIGISQLGLPMYGNCEIPLFKEVYYFAKNKGSASKGAFETLLNQMAEVNVGEKTLILADEIEAVTEPGVAGKIIAASADYFIKQGCFLVIATHLGQEIKDFLPARSRIDGIEAKGLDSENNLIVDHNPVMGRIASSTPELIIEKMARSNSSGYISHLDGFIKSNK